MIKNIFKKQKSVYVLLNMSKAYKKEFNNMTFSEFEKVNNKGVWFK